MVTVSSQPLVPGTYVDTFKIESVIGTGGFGVTYRAFDESLQRAVAIKEYYPAGLAVRAADNGTLSPRSTADQPAYGYGLQRFLDEARTLAKFDQTNIVRVIRFLQDNGTAYLVMDFEDGRSLAEVLRRMTHLNQQQARAVTVHLLTGLEAIHTKSYLHRDIKPANILIRKSGPPVLLDFGAARMALEQQTGAMTVMLTPGYAPVEQYGSEEQQGPWSDIYALGATIYHCMTGTMPVAATDRLGSILQGRDDPLESRLEATGSQFAPGFVETVRWMLRPQAADRPQSAALVLEYVKAGSSPSTRGGPPSRSELPTEENAASPASGFSEAAQAWATEEMLRRAEVAMVEHIGPIAKVLVRKASATAVSQAEFLDLLLDELEDEAERAAVRAAVH